MNLTLNKKSILAILLFLIMVGGIFAPFLFGSKKGDTSHTIVAVEEAESSKENPYSYRELPERVKEGNRNIICSWFPYPPPNHPKR